MSIPISPDSFLPWVDPKNPVTYHFRYMTGSLSEKFANLQKLLPDPKPFLTKATAEVEKENAGKRWGKGEKQRAAYALATEMATSDAGGAATMQYASGLIDLVLAGWESKEVKLPPFPEGQPSKCLRQDLIVTLSSAISDKLGDLLGLSMDEAKN